MFRPYEMPPSRGPSMPQGATGAREVQPPPVAAPIAHAPLPSNWDQLDPDQRVRSNGEW